MGTASKFVSVFLRGGQLISSIIILGILGYFLSLVSDANIYADSRIVYTVVVASISAFLSLILLLPFTYSFLAFPVDFILAILWLVAFCLMEALTGIHTCNATWYWSYWGVLWGGFWRTPRIVNGPADIGWSGCSSWRAVIAWSFISFFLSLCSAILGAYVISKYREEKRNLRNPTVRKFGAGALPPTNAENFAMREGDRVAVNNSGAYPG